VAAKVLRPELLEEVFELNMALEELRDGDESARPRLIDAQERFLEMRKEIDTGLDELFGAYDNFEESAASLRDPECARPSAVCFHSDLRGPKGTDAKELNVHLFKLTSVAKKSKIVGIDLGTTNSLVAVMDPTGPPYFLASCRVWCRFTPEGKCDRPERRRATGSSRIPNVRYIRSNA